MKFPKKHENQTLEDKSRAFFQMCVPSTWNINNIDKDYGQDLNIEISEGGTFRGLELIVQLKSSHNPNRNGEHERNVFKVSTYNYLFPAESPPPA